METEIVRKDDNTITVTRVMPVQIEFTYEYLIEQRARIVEQKERDNAQRDLEIAEIDGYLAQCKTLNVCAKAVEVAEEIIESPIISKP